MPLAAFLAALVSPPLPACPPDQRPAPQTAIGRDAPTDPHRLGDVWEVEEVSCWRGTWLRRGKSRTFDAYWVHPDGKRERARLEIWRNGSSVVVARYHGSGKYCRYDGTIAPDGRHVQGSYNCTWHLDRMSWGGQIIWMERPPPGY